MSEVVGVADHGAQAAVHSTLAMADYRTYLNLVRGVGQFSAEANWVVLGPGTLESRSPTLAHPFQAWNNFVKRESEGIAGTYLDANLWKTNLMAALDSLAVSTGRALPQGVLLAYGLAPQMAAFEAQNVAWANSALRAVDRGFGKMVPPPSAMTPEGFAMPVSISEEGAVAAVVPGSAGVLAGGPLAGMVNPIHSLVVEQESLQKKKPGPILKMN